MSEHQYKEEAKAAVACERDRALTMADEKRWYAGVDWECENHYVLRTDADGDKLVWLIATSGATQAAQMFIAIEVPHGLVAETLIECDFVAYAQVDRFRITSLWSALWTTAATLSHSLGPAQLPALLLPIGCHRSDLDRAA